MEKMKSCKSKKVGLQGAGGETSGPEVEYVNNPTGLTPKKTAVKPACLMPKDARSSDVGK